METEELRSVRICCKVTPSILNEIDRLARKKGVSHQQIVSDLLVAQIGGTKNGNKRISPDKTRLYRCRAILLEAEQEVNRLIYATEYFGDRD
jgi:hypothetical protein